MRTRKIVHRRRHGVFHIRMELDFVELGEEIWKRRLGPSK